MAYEEGFARRVRALIAGPEVTERKMFGGVCFLMRGNMACGILNSDLIVRVGAADYDDLLKLPGVREFDITGKTMKGWVMVSADVLGTKDSLAAWVGRGAAYALSLPAK